MMPPAVRLDTLESSFAFYERWLKANPQDFTARYSFQLLQGLLNYCSALEDRLTRLEKDKP